MESLYNKVTTTQWKLVSIEINPTAETILYAEHENELHIAILKRFYLGLFKTAHDYFNHHGLQLPPVLFECYYASLAMLMTTNDHHTMWRIHGKTIELLKKESPDLLLRNFRWFAWLAALRLKRINKNTVVFHWIRQLACQLGLEQNREIVDLIICSTLQSMKVHFSNYVAGYTLQWLIRRLHDSGNYDRWAVVICESLRTTCRQNLADVSLWVTYGEALAVASRERDIRHFVDNTSLSVYSVFEDDLQWLLQSRCCVQSPFVCLLRSCPSEQRKRLLGRIREASEAGEAGELTTTMASTMATTISSKLEFMTVLNAVQQRQY